MPLARKFTKFDDASASTFLVYRSIAASEFNGATCRPDSSGLRGDESQYLLLLTTTVSDCSHVANGDIAVSASIVIVISWRRRKRPSISQSASQSSTPGRLCLRSSRSPRQIYALREVLPQDSVDILVRTTLPRLEERRSRLGCPSSWQNDDLMPWLKSRSKILLRDFLYPRSSQGDSLG